MKVNVLGTEYEIIQTDEEAEETSGYIDVSTKKIYLHDISNSELGDKEEEMRSTIRHELIHAFLYESGLGFNCEWALDETIVDWFALQFPKMAKAFTKLNVLTKS